MEDQYIVKMTKRHFLKIKVCFTEIALQYDIQVVIHHLFSGTNDRVVGWLETQIGPY
jgi:hypothetical protein